MTSISLSMEMIEANSIRMPLFNEYAHHDSPINDKEDGDYELIMDVSGIVWKSLKYVISDKHIYIMLDAGVVSQILYLLPGKLWWDPSPSELSLCLPTIDLGKESGVTHTMGIDAQDGSVSYDHIPEAIKKRLRICLTYCGAVDKTHLWDIHAVIL